jgi:anti-anti-sigma regulatory factor
MEMNQKGFMEKNNSGPVKPDSTMVINLGGDLTIARAGELRRIISETLNTGEQIVLACSECADMDLSFLQLVCSAHRTALQSNSLLKLSNTLEKHLLKKAGEAGYFRETACRSDKNHECFWLRR